MKDSLHGSARRLIRCGRAAGAYRGRQPSCSGASACLFSQSAPTWRSRPCRACCRRGRAARVVERQVRAQALARGADAVAGLQAYGQFTQPLDALRRLRGRPAHRHLVGSRRSSTWSTVPSAGCAEHRSLARTAPPPWPALSLPARQPATF